MYQIPVSRSLRASFMVIVMAAILPMVHGCGDGGRSTRLAAVHDSAGVRIIEYPGSVRDLPATFRIAPDYRLNLGGERANPDHELDARSPFHDVVPLADGRYLVTDRTDLKLFDAGGAYLTSIGGEGEGPGEFRQVLRACAGPDDTVIAADYQSPRVTLFDLDGRLIATSPVPDAGRLGSGCFADGSLPVTTGIRPDPEGGEIDRLATLSRFRPTGGDPEVLGTVPAWPGVSFPSGVADAMGVTAHGDEVHVGLGLAPEVRVHAGGGDAAGELLRIIRWEEPEILFTDAALRELIEGGRLGVAIPGRTSDELFDMVRNQPRARAFPAYQRMRVDAVGRIWIQDHPYRNASREDPLGWTIFDPSGEPLGRVFLPTIPEAHANVPARLGWIGGDEVALIWRDRELGFVHLTFHALERVDPTD